MEKTKQNGLTWFWLVNVVLCLKVDRWKPSRIKPVKLNVDAACLEGRETGWGVVCRGADGGFKFAGVRRSRVQWNPEEAEAMTIDFALELARRMGIEEMEIESDCLGVILHMRKDEEREMEVGLVCAEIRAKAQQLGGVSWSFVGRNGNKPAHALAHVECTWDSEEVWADNPPYFIVPLLRENETLDD